MSGADGNAPAHDSATLSALRAVFGHGKLIECHLVNPKIAAGVVAAARGGDILAIQIFKGIKRTVEGVAAAERNGTPLVCPGCEKPINGKQFNMIIFKEVVETTGATPAAVGAAICLDCGEAEKDLRAVALKVVADFTGAARVVEVTQGASGTA